MLYLYIYICIYIIYTVSKFNMRCLKINLCNNCRRANSFPCINKKPFEEDDTDNSPYATKNAHFHKVLAKRSWSGNLMSPSYDKVNKSDDDTPPQKKVKFAHFERQGSACAAQCRNTNDNLTNTPRLVRSGGKRRDWSFEDLDALQREAKRMR
ncbi:hypothetical protein RND81_08G141500 [Saponaria officinalis]|uniref:Uncharacterized protein n=1 Tax=Saponaria officinalis TaxID=3572 RepID=A0AAW1J853_SAPOF